MGMLKVLIAEDEGTALAVYKRALDATIIEARFVENGKDALKEYSSWKPDIILLDIYMPLLTGFSVLKEIRENICDMSTAIIMVTSLAEKETVIQCMHFGIQGYIVKPFEARGLTGKILEYYKKINPEKARSARAQREEHKSCKKIHITN
ncbi:MAG: response regulator [Pseudomonadota bacterium]